MRFIVQLSADTPTNDKAGGFGRLGFDRLSHRAATGSATGLRQAQPPAGFDRLSHRRAATGSATGLRQAQPPEIYRSPSHWTKIANWLQ